MMYGSPFSCFASKTSIQFLVRQMKPSTFRKIYHGSITCSEIFYHGWTTIVIFNTNVHSYSAGLKKLQKLHIEKKETEQARHFKQIIHLSKLKYNAGCFTCRNSLLGKLKST
jgi:hypothetical protein